MKHSLILLTFCIVIVLSRTVIYASSDISALDKIDSTLMVRFDKLEENERIPVYIWRKSISQDDVYKKLFELGFDDDVFRDEDLFQKEIVSQLPPFGQEEIVSAIRDEYRISRLKVIREVTDNEKNAFLTKNNLNIENVLYFSHYTSTLIVEMTKMDVKSILQDESILAITEYKPIFPENEIFISLNQINAGYGTLQNPGLKNNSQGGYDGTGVTIGIIEADNGRFDPTAPQLAPLVISGQLEFVPVDGVTESITPHATFVTNIICGTQVVLNGLTYEGIATGAQVFQSATANNLHVYDAFNQFADLGVQVINYSAGYASTEYINFDQEIDNLIYNTKILFVKSSGNTGGNVTSPGKAFNAVTVGNVNTKSSQTSAFNPPYNMASSSSYIVNNYLSNKPEVVAPGTNIRTLSAGGTMSGTGTSLSAPHATGVIAQLIQKYYSSINVNNYITYFKARLMIGANSANVNDTNHRLGDSSIFYNAKGAGIIDATSSATPIYGWNKYVKLNSVSSNYYVYLFTPPVDYTIRTVLVYEKPENSMITNNYGNNFNLYLETPYNVILDSSTSSTNIFEMIQYTIVADQEALIRVNRASVISSNLYISITCYWKEV